MKRLGYIFLLCAGLLAAAGALYAQPRESYSVSGFPRQVYYGDTPVYGADADTFRDLGHGYGKDRYHVYRYGEMLEYVDPETFRVSSRFSADYGPAGIRPSDSDRGYRKDSFGVSFNGIKITGAVSSSFQTLGNGYAKDSFNVYWNGKEVSGAHVFSFENLGDGYAKDSFNVYWRGREIPDATSFSFKNLGGGYAEDSFNRYFRGKQVDE